MRGAEYDRDGREEEPACQEPVVVGVRTTSLSEARYPSPTPVGSSPGSAFGYSKIVRLYVSIWKGS